MVAGLGTRTRCYEDMNNLETLAVMIGKRVERTITCSAHTILDHDTITGVQVADDNTTSSQVAYLTKQCDWMLAKEGLFDGDFTRVQTIERVADCLNDIDQRCVSMVRMRCLCIILHLHHCWTGVLF